MDFYQAISENDVTIQAIKDRLNIDPPHVLAEDLQGMLMTFVQGRKKNVLNSLKLSILLQYSVQCWKPTDSLTVLELP